MWGEQGRLPMRTACPLSPQGSLHLSRAMRVGKGCVKYWVWSSLSGFLCSFLMHKHEWTEWGVGRCPWCCSWAVTILSFAYREGEVSSMQCRGLFLPLYYKCESSLPKRRNKHYRLFAEHFRSEQWDKYINANIWHCWWLMAQLT